MKRCNNAWITRLDAEFYYTHTHAAIYMQCHRMDAHNVGKIARNTRRYTSSHAFIVVVIVALQI